jgi:hypothetical protein
LLSAREGRIPGDTRTVVTLTGAGVVAVALAVSALAADDV